MDLCHVRVFFCDLQKLQVTFLRITRRSPDPEILSEVIYISKYLQIDMCTKLSQKYQHI